MEIVMFTAVHFIQTLLYKPQYYHINDTCIGFGALGIEYNLG